MDGKGRNEDSAVGIGNWCTSGSDMYTKIKIQGITVVETPIFKNTNGQATLNPPVTGSGCIPRNSMSLTFDMKDKDADLCGDDDDMGEYTTTSLPAIDTWIPSNANKDTGAYYLTAATIQDNGVDAPIATGPTGNIYDYLWNSVSTFTWNMVEDRSGIDGYWVEITYNGTVVHDSGKLTCTANPCKYAVSVNESFLIHNQEYTWRVVVKDNYVSRVHANSTNGTFKFIDDDVVPPIIQSTLAPTTIYDGDNSFFVTVEATDPVNGDDRGISETYATHKGIRFNSDFYSSIGPKITTHPYATILSNPTVVNSVIDQNGDTENYFVQNGIFYTNLKDINPNTEATEGEHSFNYYATGSFTIPTLTTTNLGYGGRTFGEKTLKSVDVNVSYSLYHNCDGWFKLFGEEIFCSVEMCVFGSCIGGIGENYIKVYYSLDGGNTYILGNSVSRSRTNQGTSIGTFTFNVPNVNEGSTITIKVEHSGSTKPVWKTETYKSSQVSVEIIRTYNWTIASQALIEITNPVKLISSNNAYDVFAVDNDTDRANDMLAAQRTLYYSVIDDDETDPTVFLLIPSVRTIIGKSNLPFTFTASADDESGIASVEFKVGTTSVGIDTNYEDGWAVNWNGGIADGEYAVTAIATDNDVDRPGDQRSATSTSVNIVLDTIDPIAPTLIAPTYSNTGNVVLSWSGASDANGIFKYVIMRRCIQSLRFADEYDPVFKKIGEVGGNKNTYTDTGRLDAATYEYKYNCL